MKIYYSDDTFYFYDYTNSIFLAGPSPRGNLNTYNWRDEAIKELKKQGFKGNVFIPLPKSGTVFNYINQIEWELKHLENVDKILFWVPRDLKTLPGFTTNVEFGMYIKSNKIFYGRPLDAPKCKYLDAIYRKYCNDEPYIYLNNLIKHTIKSK